MNGFTFFVHTVLDTATLTVKSGEQVVYQKQIPRNRPLSIRVVDVDLSSASVSDIGGELSVLKTNALLWSSGPYQIKSKTKLSAVFMGPVACADGCIKLQAEWVIDQ